MHRNEPIPRNNQQWNLQPFSWLGRHPDAPGLWVQTQVGAHAGSNQRRIDKWNNKPTFLSLKTIK